MCIESLLIFRRGPVSHWRFEDKHDLCRAAFLLIFMHFLLGANETVVVVVNYLDTARGLGWPIPAGAKTRRSHGAMDPTAPPLRRDGTNGRSRENSAATTNVRKWSKAPINIPNNRRSRSAGRHPYPVALTQSAPPP
jgi:hypothetical protein